MGGELQASQEVKTRQRMKRVVDTSVQTTGT